MAEADVSPMHTEFAHWHSAIGLGDDQQRWQARWNGVIAVVDDVDREIVEALVRLAFGTRRKPSAGSLETIRQAFRSADETFDMKGSDREMQVLAGASLAILMEHGGNMGAAAALAVTTAAAGGALKANVPMELGVLAEEAIARIAEVHRMRPDLAGRTLGEVPKFDFETSAAKAREIPNADGFAQAFTLAASAVRSAMLAMAKRQANAVCALENFVQVQDEELQMLWWLTGQRSWDYDCSFDAVPTDAQSLVFAKELADHTEVLPGPLSIKALLSRAGLKERKKITIPAAINAADPAWLKKLIGEGDPSPVSTPLHFAIKYQLDTGPGDAWVAGWAGVTGVATNYTISPLALSTLFYRERLLVLFE